MRLVFLLFQCGFHGSVQEAVKGCPIHLEGNRPSLKINLSV